MHERLDDPDLLSIAPRQFWDRPIEHDVEPFDQRLTPCLLDRSAESCKRVELLPAGQSVKEAEISRHIPNVTPRLHAVGAAIVAEDPRLAARGADQIEEEPDRRAFPGAIRAKKGEDLAPFDPQIESGQCADATGVRLRERRRLNRRRQRHQPIAVVASGSAISASESRGSPLSRRLGSRRA